MKIETSFVNTSAQRIRVTQKCELIERTDRFIPFERMCEAEELCDETKTWKPVLIHKLLTFDPAYHLAVDVQFWHEEEEDGVSFYWVDLEGSQVGRFETFSEAQALQEKLLSTLSRYH